MRIHFRTRFSKPKRWSKLSLRTKLVFMCSGLAILSVAAVGSLALSSIMGVGDYALESQTSLGEQAVTDSTKALEKQAEEHLLGLAKDQAAISNALFEKIEAETNTMAMFASTPNKREIDLADLVALLDK